MNQEGKEGSRVILISVEAQEKKLTSFSIDAERGRSPADRNYPPTIFRGGKNETKWDFPDGAAPFLLLTQPGIRRLCTPRENGSLGCPGGWKHRLLRRKHSPGDRGTGGLHREFILGDSIPCPLGLRRRRNSGQRRTLHDRKSQRSRILIGRQPNNRPYWGCGRSIEERMWGAFPGGADELPACAGMM
jgi:hypothetical protein